jgi:hypothetical protein
MAGGGFACVLTLLHPLKGKSSHHFRGGSLLFWATSRRDPDGWHFERKPTGLTGGRHKESRPIRTAQRCGSAAASAQSLDQARLGQAQLGGRVHNVGVAEQKYFVREGVVEVHEEGRTVWRGQVLGVSALTVFSLPRTPDGVVLLDWMDRPPGIEAGHPYQNVLRIRADGSIVWRAELPSGETVKSFTATSWDEGKLIAQAWSHRCVLDPETGHILETTFTK